MRNFWQKLDIALGLLAIGAGSVFLLEIEYPGFISRWGFFSAVQWNDPESTGGVADLTRDEGRLRFRNSESSVWRDFDFKQAPVRQGDAIYTSVQSGATLIMKEGGATAKIGAESLVVVKKLRSDETSGSSSPIRLEIKKGKVTLEIPPSDKQEKPLSVEIAGKVYEFQPPAKSSAAPTSLSSGSAQPTSVELSLVSGVGKVAPQVLISSPSEVVQVKVKPIEPNEAESPTSKQSIVQLTPGKIHIEKIDRTREVSLKSDPLVLSVEREQLKGSVSDSSSVDSLASTEVEPQRQIAAVEQSARRLPELKQELVKQIELPEDKGTKRPVQLEFSLELLMGQRAVTDRTSSLGADFALDASPGFELVGEFPISSRWSVYPEVRASLARVKKPSGSVQLTTDQEFIGDFLAGIGAGGDSFWGLRFSAGLARRLSFAELSTTSIRVGTTNGPMVQAHARLKLSPAFDLGLKSRGLILTDESSGGSNLGYEQEILVRFYPKKTPNSSERPNNQRFFWGAGCELGRYSLPSSQMSTLDFLIRWGLD